MEGRTSARRNMERVLERYCIKLRRNIFPELEKHEPFKKEPNE